MGISRYMLSVLKYLKLAFVNSISVRGRIAWPCLQCSNGDEHVIYG